MLAIVGEPVVIGADQRGFQLAIRRREHRHAVEQHLGVDRVAFLIVDSHHRVPAAAPAVEEGLADRLGILGAHPRVGGDEVERHLLAFEREHLDLAVLRVLAMHDLRRALAILRGQPLGPDRRRRIDVRADRDALVFHVATP
jgi:hypothetical protein